ncbi:LysR family transcriptional regulator [Nocardia terpenica]|uniref:LysR family transcriptional regulator n=1 Tax=Nocardia terpenica TaxID=455432 RepID=A0A6G9Z4C7_9NOCA|nr:LysR family transcriptional regulator [Nocardia terpenica]
MNGGVIVIDVELRQLRAFAAVVAEGGFTAAADELRTDQPRVTRAVQGLEAAVGARLLERTTRRVRLTDAGRRLYAELEVLLPRLEAALAAPARAETVRFGFAWHLPARWPDVVRAFDGAAGDTGGIRVVRRDDPLAALAAGLCDLALIHTDPGPDYRTVALPPEPRVAAVPVPGPWQYRRVLDWSELAGRRLVVNTLADRLGDADWPGGTRGPALCTADNLEEWLESVAADHGVGIAPDSVRRHTNPSVRYVRLKNAPEVPMLLARPLRNPHPAADRLAGVVQRVLAASN